MIELGPIAVKVHMPHDVPKNLSDTDPVVQVLYFWCPSDPNAGIGRNGYCAWARSEKERMGQWRTK